MAGAEMEEGVSRRDMMATGLQLEIIGPGGEVEFRALDLERGITNIGRHPDNDVVVADAEVALFHLVIDHRRRPYRIMALDEEGETWLRGERLVPGVAVEIDAWEVVSIGDYDLVLVEEGTLAPAPVEDRAEVPELLHLALPDVGDEFIVVELSPREWTVDVEQTAIGQVTIVNGGELVATFEVQIAGLDEDWVDVPVKRVNLIEGARATLGFEITPPRSSQSRAGPHRFQVVVTSPQYPGHLSCTTATLTINPYYEFAVSELTPRRQAISWRKAAAEARLTIFNRGNVEGVYQVMGEDDERALSFEFLLPDREEVLVRRAEFHLPAGEQGVVTVKIVPLRRPLVAIRGQAKMFTVTTLAGGQMPRAVVGQLVLRPLLGLLHVVVLAVLLAVVIALVTRPEIYSFAPDSWVVETGEETTLNWHVSPFAFNVRIESGEGEVIPLAGVVGKTRVQPKGPASTYYLRADHWLSRFDVVAMSVSRKLTVLVRPLVPVIDAFVVDRRYIVRGESVKVAWSVRYAEQLVLRVGDLVMVIPPEEYTGERVLTPGETTLLSLEARNVSAAALKSMMVWVSSPQIKDFAVQPAAIVAGEGVTITWRVSNVDSVAIAPLSGVYPPAGSIVQYPQQTTDYVLSAAAGDEQVLGVRRVIVHPAPTPTPEPQPPVIEFFNAVPAEVVQGDKVKVQLAWSVVGEVTSVVIEGGVGFRAADLASRGFVEVVPDRSTVFVLTACTGDLCASRSVEIKGVEPTPTEEPTPTATPMPTATPTPTPDLPVRPTPLPTPGGTSTLGRLPPVIVSYRLDDVDGSGGVLERALSDEEVALLYRVRWGTRVRLRWEVWNAEQVFLNARRCSPSSEEVFTAVGDASYVLVAQNGGGTVVERLEVRVEFPPELRRIFLPFVARRVR